MVLAAEAPKVIERVDNYVCLSCWLSSYSQIKMHLGDLRFD